MAVKAGIKVKSASGTLCEYENDVTVKANQVCNIHGAFFSHDTTLGFSVSNAWGATTDYDL